GAADGVNMLYAFTRGRGAWRVILGATTCSQTLSQTRQSFNAAGGTGAGKVTATSGSCGVTAISNANRITINPGRSGSGQGMVNFTVDANMSLSPRTGTLTIAGRSVAVFQEGDVDTISPTVTITSPVTSSTYTTSSAAITIGGTASDNVGVKVVKWS